MHPKQRELDAIARQFEAFAQPNSRVYKEMLAKAKQFIRKYFDCGRIDDHGASLDRQTLVEEALSENWFESFKKVDPAFKRLCDEFVVTYGGTSKYDAEDALVDALVDHFWNKIRLEHDDFASLDELADVFDGISRDCDAEEADARFESRVPWKHRVMASGANWTKKASARVASRYLRTAK
jgi:hypothetical protein